jgi:hypothetical protein
MMEAAPAPPFEVAKANLLFDFVVVALNAPAQFGGVDKLDLPRFRGRLRAWDQGIWSDGILPSCLVSFFCLALGRAILPSRPARAAVGCSGGQGRPHFGAARRARP